jgi:type II secretory pathway component PulF
MNRLASLKKSGGSFDLESWLIHKQFKSGATMRASLYEKLASLINDGKPLDAALRQMHSRYAEKKRALSPILRAWVNSMDEGKTFADSSRGYISDTESVIIAAGEKSGDLAGAFEQAALVARAGADINKAVRSELTTPAVQVVVLIGLMVGFSTSVAPGLSQSVPHSALDDSQKMLFGLASVIAKTWFIVVPLLVAGFWAALWSMPRYTGPARKFLDKIPPWSVYRIYSGSTFMISLSALIKAGIPIEAAIRFIRAQSSPWMREHTSVMVGRLRSGADQGEAMDVGLLGDDLADTVAIYSKTTNFDAAMNSVGKEAIKTGIESIRAKAGMAKIVSTLLIGLFVGWMFDAMMGISDAAQRASQQQSASQAQQRGR